MADPYRQQHVPPSPRPAPSPQGFGAVVKFAAGLILATASVVLIVVSVMQLTQRPGSSPAPASTRSPAVQHSSARPVNPSEARPGVDMGAGTPNAPCSTNRLGMFFVKDGVTYTCKGPAPYRWLA